ncbi:MGMT family protein [Patescibacteria group bacterium]
MATKFAQKVYRALAKVPKGKVTTYGKLARIAGSPGAARAVGSLMRNNQHPEIYPCYKVVLSDGRVGSYSGPGGQAKKIKLLRRDGIVIESGRINKLDQFV